MVRTNPHPPLDYPVILPTEEGVHLARERASGFSQAAALLVYTIAVLAIGFVAGQVVTQLAHDARAYELSQRV